MANKQQNQGGPQSGRGGTTQQQPARHMPTGSPATRGAQQQHTRQGADPQPTGQAIPLTDEQRQGLAREGRDLNPNRGEQREFDHDNDQGDHEQHQDRDAGDGEGTFMQPENHGEAEAAVGSQNIQQLKGDGDTASKVSADTLGRLHPDPVRAPGTPPIAGRSAAHDELDRQEQIQRDTTALQQDASRRTEMVRQNAASPALTPATAGNPGEATVTMVSPREFFLQLADGRKVRFTKGPQEVVESLVDHYYVKAHKVTRYQPNPQDNRQPVG